MRLIKTLPRFRCDFCRRTSTEKAMVAHEKICWRNPNRLCPACGNSGIMVVDSGTIYGDQEFDCYYCAQRHAPIQDEAAS